MGMLARAKATDGLFAGSQANTGSPIRPDGCGVRCVSINFLCPREIRRCPRHGSDGVLLSHGAFVRVGHVGRRHDLFVFARDESVPGAMASGHTCETSLLRAVRHIAESQVDPAQRTDGGIDACPLVRVVDWRESCRAINGGDPHGRQFLSISWVVLATLMTLVQSRRSLRASR